MASINTKQTEYLLKTLLPRAEQLVSIIKGNPNLLKPLIEEQLINARDLDTFITTLDLLPKRIKELVEQKKYVINDELPGDNKALAIIRKKDDVVYVDCVQLRSELLDPESAETVTMRVRTLLHEVSHTILINKIFPIQDYCYFGAWAISHLGSLCFENADT